MPPNKRRIPRQVTRQRQSEAWELRQQFWTYQQIADKLGVSKEGVRQLLDRYEKDIVGTDTVTNEVRREQMDFQLRYLSEQALLGWHRSLQDAETYRETTDENGTKTEVTRKGQSGNAAHIANARELIADLRRMYGVDAAPKAAVVEEPKEQPPDNGPKSDKTKKSIDV